jgi:hypothetical protein
MKKLLSAFLAVVLVGCGGGGESTDDVYVFDITSYDDYSRPVETYTPPANQILFFPLALHFRTITKSYVSKVGTTATREYSISGSMTTPTINSGTYNAKMTSTIRYQGSTLFEGASVIPVAYDNRRYQITLNATPQADENTSSTSYYDTTYGIRIGSKGSNYYKVIDTKLSKPLPEIALVGETGDFLVYQVYSDSSKKTPIGLDVLGYKILSTSLGAGGEYKANIEYITRSYSIQGQLLGVQTSTDESVYSISAGAGSRNISLYVDDVSGTTTSRLLYTRLK